MSRVKIWALSTALAIGGAMVALSGNAWAGFVVKDFSCTTTPLGVNFDVSGLGTTNICVIGTAHAALACACLTGGGNCTSDTKKATGTTTIKSGTTVAPKNGRASGSFTLAPNVNNSDCVDIGLACGSGQDETLIEFKTDQPVFAVCTTAAAAGAPCSCSGTPLATATCVAGSGTPNPGKHNSCVNLFPGF